MCAVHWLVFSFTCSIFCNAVRIEFKFSQHVNVNFFTHLGNFCVQATSACGGLTITRGRRTLAVVSIYAYFTRESNPEAMHTVL